MSAEWSEDEMAVEREWQATREAAGFCPYTSVKIGTCWSTKLCDCAYGPPPQCPLCGLTVWDVVDHNRRQHVDPAPR